MNASQPSPILPLNTRFGSYQLEKLIAVGGMAEIYLARAKGLAGFEKQLALKVIHADFASDDRFTQMLVQEAKLAVALNHANIVKTFDLGKIGNVYFITMEYVDGADYFRVLKRLSEQDQNVPIEAALFIAREVAVGLDYAHTRCDERGEPLGLIHRDISPQNILLSRHGEVKIADFGVAKVANVSSQTRAGVIKGKLVYMSPEQSWGEQIDQRSDIFSAGIVLYEALTGGSLYVEQNPVKLLQQVREAVIPPPSSIRPDLGSELDELVMKALARDPAHRYQSARELEGALNELLRRYAPDYSARDLAEIVRAVADHEPMPRSKRKQSSAPGIEPMERNDFAIPRHSIVYASKQMASKSAAHGEASRDQVGAVGLKGQIILERDGNTRTYELKDRFTIGRGGELRLTDGRVSRRHARILVQDDRYVIEDLKSSNGTFVNRERLTGARDLQDGDTIHIGPYQLRFVLERYDDTRREARAEQPVSGEGVVSAPAAAVPELAREVGSEPELAPSAAPHTSSGRGPAPACLVVQLGDEQLNMTLGERMPLEHALDLGGRHIEAAAGEIVWRAGAYWIEPKSGRIALTVNGQALSEPRRLEPGDELHVGPLRLRFQQVMQS